VCAQCMICGVPNSNTTVNTTVTTAKLCPAGGGSAPQPMRTGLDNLQCCRVSLMSGSTSGTATNTVDWVGSYEACHRTTTRRPAARIARICSHTHLLAYPLCSDHYPPHVTLPTSATSATIIVSLLSSTCRHCQYDQYDPSPSVVIATPWHANHHNCWRRRAQPPTRLTCYPTQLCLRDCCEHWTHVSTPPARIPHSRGVTRHTAGGTLRQRSRGVAAAAAASASSPLPSTAATAALFLLMWVPPLLL